MTPLLHAASLLSAAAAGALFSAIWQGTLLVACVALCLRLLPGLSAAARSAVWFNVFVLLVLLHLVPAFPAQGSRVAGVPSSPIHLGLRWSLLVAGIWAALSLWRMAQLVVSAIRLHRMTRRAALVRTGAELQACLRPFDEKTHARAAGLYASADVTRPCVFGLFRPRILVPPGLIEQISGRELALVLQHEMEHLRRGDLWSNLLQKLALALFPLNPALYWVERRLCVERELACDDHVLSASASRKAYAMCLTRLAEYSMVSRGLSLVLGAWERHSELARRVHRILWRQAKAMPAPLAMLTSAAIVLAAAAAGFALARTPPLVSFASRKTVAPQIVAVATTQPAHQVNPRREGGAPELVKAVLPVKPLQTSHRLRTLRAREVRRSERPLRVTPPQVWVVLTAWQAAATPPRIVPPVVRRPRPSFAAVDLPDGWLIVQI